MGANIDGQQPPIQEVYNTVSDNGGNNYTQEEFVEDFTSAFDEVKAQEDQNGGSSNSGINTGTFYNTFLGKVETRTGQSIDPNSQEGKALLGYMEQIADSGSSFEDADYFNHTEMEMAVDSMQGPAAPPQGQGTPQSPVTPPPPQLSPEEADFQSKGGAQSMYRQDVSNDGLSVTYTLADGTKAVYTREKGSTDWTFDPTQYQPAQTESKDEYNPAHPPKSDEEDEAYWANQGSEPKQVKPEEVNGTYTPPPKAEDEEDGALASDTPAKAEFNEVVKKAAEKEALDLSYDFSYGNGFVKTYDQALEDLSNTIALHYNIPIDKKDDIEAKCAEILSNNGRSNSAGNALISILRIANNGQGGSDDYLRW